MFRTKKFFVVTAELVISATLGCVALALSLPSYMPWTIAFFWMTAFASATQDIAADGVYIASMSPREQALFAGVQGVAWNIGRIIASGLLVSFTGKLHDDHAFSWHQAWMAVMAVLALIMVVSAAWHTKNLPTGGKAADAPVDLAGAARVFADAFATFFKRGDRGNDRSPSSIDSAKPHREDWPAFFLPSMIPSGGLPSQQHGSGPIWHLRHLGVHPRRVAGWTLFRKRCAARCFSSCSD
jgi:MFS family permease